MMSVPGYRIVEKYQEEISWTIYKAYSIEGNKMVGLKMMNNEEKNLRVAEVVHDYHMTKNLNHHYILEASKLEKHATEVYIVTELFPGITMRKWMETSVLDLSTFLNIALRISDALEVIHHEHIIHKSLQPQNILINPITHDIKITGFDQATTLSQEMLQPHITPYHLKSQVSYWSPEQTGRMNRVLDYRTDLYSLGIIFYEMATRTLPFVMKNHADIIHAHIAVTPELPHKVNKLLPTQISAIIMKLLDKSSELRYQSVYGLKEDLKKCLNQFHLKATVTPFKLGEKDSSVMLKKPYQLIGVEENLQQLIEGVERFKRGSKELLLVAGPSGIGKTVLIKELNKSLIKEQGYFVSGKFVHLKKDIPYAPVIQAFQSLIRQILSEGSASINKWRDVMERELSANGAVFANFIPEIEWLIGPQIKVSDLPPGQTHNRFILTVKTFVKLFANAEHPLVLFLDDLQWADRATLDLIEYLLIDTELKNLLVVGAYRDNEVSVGDPFEVMLHRLADNEMKIRTVTMHPLNYVQIKEWIDQALSIKDNEAPHIYDLVYRITQGNPLFIAQLLQYFYEDNVIYFHAQTNRWDVNIENIDLLSTHDSMIYYIVKRIDKLPRETKEVLQLASCFGNNFDLKLLAEITKESYVKMAKKIWYGIEEGLVLPLDASYKWAYIDENEYPLDGHPAAYLFLHDKIQRAIYQTMPLETREMYHLKIGNVLLDLYASDLRGDHVFEIVNHLNVSRHLLDATQLLELAKWNAVAGEKAKDNAASEAALTFYTIGKELLPAQSWQVCYKLSYDIMVGLGEAKYLTQKFSEAEEVFDEILVHAKSLEQRVRIYNLKVMLYTHIHHVGKATEAGLEGVRLFNWNIQSRPKKWQVGKEYILAKIALKMKRKVDLLHLPAVTEKDAKLAMGALINTNAPAYHVNQNLATILMLRALRLTLKYGDMEMTALVYNNYALTLSAGFGDYDGSYEFGKLAIDHIEKYGNKSLKARVFFVFGTFVNHWKKHMRHNVDYLERSQQLCIESGNLHLAGASASFIGIILFIKGDSLDRVAEGIKRQLVLARLNKFALSDDFLGELNNWLAVLSNDKEVNWNLPEFTDDPSAIIIHYTLRLQMTYLLDNEQEAIIYIEKLDKLVNETLILVVAPEYCFYYCLWIIKFMRNKMMRYDVGKRKLKKKMKKMKNWAKNAPDNYLHQYLLLKAEVASLNKEKPETIRLYNRAISLAVENGFVQDVAITNECVGNYYLGLNLPKSAESYIVASYLFYKKWGADRVATIILEMYPEIIFESRGKYDALTMTSSLDLEAVFQATTLISDEVNYDLLITKMLQTMLVHGGAEKCVLMLMNEGELQIVASHDTVKGNQVNHQPISIKGYESIPLTLIDYVAHSEETVVLGNASENNNFVTDSYIIQNKVKSILSLPIIYKRELTGILYLENNQSHYIFTEDRIRLLTLLASQAAISIDNANLYSQLEEKVEQRTQLLNEVNKDLMNANHSLAESREERLQMLANISHDLRSPLASVHGYVDAILDGIIAEPKKQKHYLEAVKSRLTSLNGLIQDLFDLAQLESGGSSFAMDIIPINQLFTHLTGLFELEVQQAGLTYESKLPDLAGKAFPLVEVDVRRIEQVVANLVTNAVKHTKQGVIRVTLSLELENRAIISVSDEGDGIPTSEISHVFDRFYTRKRSAEKRGHGLGLLISKEIMEYHQGTIAVESIEGQGALFSISFPTFDII